MDDQTGRWVPIEEDEDDLVMVGQMPMAMRADFVVRGSYAIEDDKRYYFYWNDADELVFRTDDQRICLLRRQADGGLVDQLPDLDFDVQFAVDGDGRLIPDMSTFSLSEPGCPARVKVHYNSERYLRYFLGNYTFVPDEDLSDWDFFIYVKRSLDELKRFASAITTQPRSSPRETVQGDLPVTVVTGEFASRSGLWAAAHHLDRRCRLALGEAAPDIGGRSEIWVWVMA